VFGPVDVPETRYARSGDLQIAYQVVGEGPLDLMFIPTYVSNIELFWELPSLALLFERLASFSRLILFERRGSGMSDGIPGATPLEEQIDDVQAVIDAIGSEQPVLFSFLEGCGLTAMFAASHPNLVRALILLSPQPRLVAGPGYEWAPSVEERARIVEAIVGSWGTNSPANPLAVLAGGEDERLRGLLARAQRLAMSAAAALEWIGQTDVREVLPSVQCPTLVMRPENDTYLDPRHSLYVAEHVPNALYVELPGEGTRFFGEAAAIADEVEHFLTGSRSSTVPAAPSAARPRSATASTTWASRFAPACTPASASCSTTTSAGSLCTSARASRASPAPERCSPRAPSATSSSAQARH